MSMLQGLDQSVQKALLPLAHMLDERDRQLEDYINQLMRRNASMSLRGDGSDHTGTTNWIVVAPQVEIVFAKARKRSHLTVGVQTAGRYLNANGGYVKFGVTGLDGSLATIIPDTEVCRRPFQGNQHDTVLNAGGWADIGLGLHGTMVLLLEVQVDNPDTDWQSSLHGTMSLTVTESM